MPNLSDLFSAGGFLKWDGAGNADADYSSNTPAELAADAAFTGAFAPRVLAESVYDPVTLTTVAPTSTSFVDVDATNLSVTFTVPSTGIVVVDWSVMLIGAASTTMELNLREAAADVAGTDRRMLGYVVVHVGATYRARVTGLTPNTETTWKLGVARGNGSGAVQVAYGGAAGPAICRVTAGV